jgi:hypothetical protein
MGRTPPRAAGNSPKKISPFRDSGMDNSDSIRQIVAVQLRGSPATAHPLIEHFGEPDLLY